MCARIFQLRDMCVDSENVHKFEPDTSSNLRCCKSNAFAREQILRHAERKHKSSSLERASRRSRMKLGCKRKPTGAASSRAPST
mmetsp:Transcript_3325/g.10150  ORF Transcript_3325/g.10150 Transcript_3325/m.10150 type:complete len:84 (-) Transcript_3325:108-359(-)